MFTMEFDRLVYVFIVVTLLCKYTDALDYTRHNLTAVPRRPVWSVNDLHLDISDNCIVVLNDTSFIGYDNLIGLFVINNNLKYIMDGTFNKMYQLELLFMNFNNIIQLPSVFGPSENTLKTVSLWMALDDSSIIIYPYFATFVNLQDLNLGGNFFMQLRDGSKLPPNVTDLNLKKSGIYDFPFLSVFSPHVKYFTINDNRIKEIPQSAIAWLSELVEFDAGDNYITQFPSFVNYSLLTKLYMEINKITVVPRENIEGLIQLRIFWLQKNLLSSMTNISHLTSLEDFHTGYNMIRELPEDIFQGLPNLRKLSCEYNQISALPDLAALLPSLEEFYVQGNSLLTLPDYYTHSSPLIFHVQDNPFVCNRSLCWLRLLAWINPTSHLDLDSPTCAEPPIVVDARVRRAHPTGMECYDGNQIYHNFYSRLKLLGLHRCLISAWPKYFSLANALCVQHFVSKF